MGWRMAPPSNGIIRTKWNDFAEMFSLVLDAQEVFELRVRGPCNILTSICYNLHLTNQETEARSGKWLTQLTSMVSGLVRPQRQICVTPKAFQSRTQWLPELVLPVGKFWALSQTCSSQFEANTESVETWFDKQTQSLLPQKIHNDLSLCTQTSKHHVPWRLWWHQQRSPPQSPQGG